MKGSTKKANAGLVLALLCIGCGADGAAVAEPRDALFVDVDDDDGSIEYVWVECDCVGIPEQIDCPITYSVDMRQETDRDFYLRIPPGYNCEVSVYGANRGDSVWIDFN